MATAIKVPDDLARHLEDRALQLNVSVDELAAKLLAEGLAQGSKANQPDIHQEGLTALDQVIAAINCRNQKYAGRSR